MAADETKPLVRIDLWRGERKRLRRVMFRYGNCFEDKKDGTNVLLFVPGGQ